MANEITKAEALNSLCDNPQFVIRDTEIEWHSLDITQPTDAEIDAEVIRLQAEYDSQEYARNRKAEYPSIVDQLDDIYHNGVDGWKATIKTTKDKYPKE
jgi:hypothetical protein